MPVNPQVNQDVSPVGPGATGAAGVAANAAKPKRASDDAGMAEQHSIKDQILGQQFAESAVGVEKRSRGLRFNVISPPGAV
jgi:hypothetical protein